MRSAPIWASSLARWLRGRLGRLAGVLGETAAAVTLGARARGARAWQTSGLALALAREARVQANAAPPARRRAGVPREGAASLARNFGARAWSPIYLGGCLAAVEGYHVGGAACGVR